ncbi:hypothetical protein AB6A40_002418 [Gnathostoma spinigerum]|uniref:Protein farnesyltransferase subunit beta n=1 Tax=Gnathostoma spinigerum TaxID=75299 RepID=A0ABD6EEC7_9BILA
METEQKIHKFTAFDPNFVCNDDGFFTLTTTEQKRVEELFSKEYKHFMDGYLDNIDESVYAPVLLRNTHVNFVTRYLKELNQSYSCLDASRTWLCYWGVHSLRLLEAPEDPDLFSDIVRFIKTCESPDGGYGGGPGQYPHLATTYGAVMALISIGTKEALASINRKTLRSFLLSVKQSDGSFCLHEGGENDIRGAYCALAVASVTNILDEKLCENTDRWIISCQTYEGGFGGEPRVEAHGGYTFCGVAALTILGKTALIHTPSLYKWLANKQMRFEGGFQGRTNKLVDGCYSFWQASVFLLLEAAMHEISREMFDAKALQEFILVGCQDREHGGLVDKPGKMSDLYHTCYALSGLSIAQSCCGEDNLVGGSHNQLARISPVYSICKEAEKEARMFFANE